MPRLCLLAGIVIFINTRDHFPPHFHAEFGGESVLIVIADLSVYAGGIEAKKQKLLLRWAAVHQDELMRNWELAQAGLPHEKIAPTLTKED